MRRALLAVLMLVAAGPKLAAQPRLLNVRLSFLAFPATPLLTVEVRVLPHITLQAETNFIGIHGLNLKYFASRDLDGPYVFVGNAWVKHPMLRAEGGYTWLPYTGGGYSMPFGGGSWVADGRAGLGAALGADRFGIYPVVKVGVGRWLF
jgi:hypothetical protein